MAESRVILLVEVEDGTQALIFRDAEAAYTWEAIARQESGPFTASLVPLVSRRSVLRSLMRGSRRRDIGLG